MRRRCTNDGAAMSSEADNQIECMLAEARSKRGLARRGECGGGAVDAVADAVADEEESKQATEDGCCGRGDIEAMSRCGELRPTLAARCDGLRPGWRRKRRTSEEKAVRASSQFSLSLLSLSHRDRGGPASLNRFEVGASAGARAKPLWKAADAPSNAHLQLSRQRVCVLALLRAHLASQNCKMKLSRPAPTLSRSKGQRSTAQRGSRPRNSAGVGWAAGRAGVRPHSCLHLHHLLHSQRTCIHPRTLPQQQQQQQQQQRMHHCYG
ncbi:hypothetical protein L1887_47173 [Cichorium endivia]|nr:hypothetical protein L1887_47173 [Cichorium endivia]